MYYLRSKPAVTAIAFGLDHDSITRIRKKRGLHDNHISNKNYDKNKKVDRRNNNYIECEMCSGWSDLK